jgi:hypothetical protein
MGSPAIASLVGHAAFWVLLIVGWSDLGPRRAGMFLVLWLVGFVASAFGLYSAGLFPPYVALLDIALIFVVFKGDVRLY